MTCIMSYSYCHYDGGTSCDTGCTHHASAGLVEIVERKRDGRVGGKGHEHGGNRQSSVAACAAVRPVSRLERLIPAIVAPVRPMRESFHTCRAVLFDFTWIGHAEAYADG
jgi:hypothetical protein